MKNLINILIKAGEIALLEQSKMEVKVKSDKSIVTNGDILVSDFFEKELKKEFPDFEVFSEENAGQKPKGSKIIVIDPIDGTQSYSRKQDTWSMLVGFIEDGVITKGYVYQPTRGRLFYAHKGEGAFLLENGKTTKLTGRSSGKLVAHSSPTRAGEGDFLTKNGVEEIIFMYSASLKIMEIAMGNSDVYPNFQKKCSWWDLIAPTIILEEAGGKIIYEDKVAVSFENPHVNTRLLALGLRTIHWSF